MERKRPYMKDLNLSEAYVADADALWVLREPIQNARDAGGEIITFPDVDSCIIETPTHPTLDQSVVMGEGTKSDDDDMIGEFGEGMKLAALVATRRKNCSLEYETAFGYVTYEFKRSPGMQTRTLHARIDPTRVSAVFRAHIKLKGVAQLYTENFLSPDAPNGPFEKAKGSRGMRVFVKGILIKRVPESSFYDWNLKRCKLNRDRTVPDSYDMMRSIGTYVKDEIEAGDEAWALKVLESPDQYESKSVARGYCGPGVRNTMTRVFIKKYGENAILASADQRINSLAAYKGSRVIPLDSSLQEILDVKHAHEVVGKADRLIPSEVEPDPAMIAELEFFRDVLGMPFTIQPFKYDGNTLGAAKIKDSAAIVWICESLFVPGMREERLQTLFHELGHLKGGNDCGAEFEASLHTIAAKLGERLLTMTLYSRERAARPPSATA
jgi:hypothetical protein